MRNIAVRLSQHGPAQRYWIGYSGGLDSHVLLHQCAGLNRNPAHPEFCGKQRFTAVHVHHGLQAAADEWATHCAAVCAELDLPFRLIHVDAQALPGQSPEEAARNARYRAFAELLAEGDVLLTAQHADDQAETVLLQLLRGSGLAGLAAMPEAMPFGKGRLLRPLLAWNRTALQDYARIHRLSWQEDPSNQQTAFDRNFIRHQILPLLTQRWPGVAVALSRTARHCAEAQGQLERWAEDLLHEAAAGEADGTLSVAALRRRQAPEQRLVLRHWLKQAGFRAPSTVVLQRVIHEALAAAQDRSPCVAWREGEIRRYRDRLYALPPLPALDAQEVFDWNGDEPLLLPGNGVLTAVAQPGPGIKPELWRGAKQVRYRQGGERCRLPRRQGNHLLKKLFQEDARLPPWVRERVPLLYIDGQLAAVGDLWICEPFADATHGIALHWNETRLKT
ncbi:MAG: tRNA lysidine(34) synthetase TilS [Methylococcaceae bacterium]|nr:MAG: tRNA lysidine(34) synthetase TilS [Methylococcaceae bacterium]